MLLAAEPELLARARALGYALVVGLAGRHARSTLLKAGADLVLRRIEELDPHHLPTRQLPSAFAAIHTLRAELKSATPRLFLDYDGTLTPIVDQPAQARLTEHQRAILRSVSARAKIALVSGRDLADLRRRVALPELIQVGSHGYEALEPAGGHWVHPDAGPATRALAELERVLRFQLPQWPGCVAERKAYGLAIHYRHLPEHRVGALEQWLLGLAGRWPALRPRDGKKVLEFVPDLAWDKARAVKRLLAGAMRGRGPAVYIGDDLTDEDVFFHLRGEIIGLRVGKEAGASYAQYQLDDVEAVYRLLWELVRPGVSRSDQGPPRRGP
ncbi:trehalose-phosphatase [Alkalilimnicola sp. S0819]|uniref:trehalose-phosphatase n=1 Tax=Alkalilimnicola sp. S0819 TaxID=2613922 RepID=UPI001869765B|nr:trehalose-phosphatase [Alkalilimnicola sp. S0819]